jgi:excisionase family DNA binding protein
MDKNLFLPYIVSGHDFRQEVVPMNSVSAREVEDYRLLTVEELALVCHVKTRTVYDWIARGAVPYRKAGRRALFRLDEIEEWMEQRGLKLEQIA